MSIDELIEFPDANHLQAKLNSRKTWRVILLMYWVISLCLGVFLIMLPILFPEDGEDFFVYGLLVSLLGLVFLLGWLRLNSSTRKLEAEIVQNTQEYISSERVRLKALQESMTVAEWENYKLQLQNQRLLRDIKNKPGYPRTTTTTGFIAGVSDD